MDSKCDWVVGHRPVHAQPDKAASNVSTTDFDINSYLAVRVIKNWEPEISCQLESHELIQNCIETCHVYVTFGSF